MPRDSTRCSRLPHGIPGLSMWEPTASHEFTGGTRRHHTPAEVSRDVAGSHVDSRASYRGNPGHSCDPKGCRRMLTRGPAGLGRARWYRLGLVDGTKSTEKKSNFGTSWDFRGVSLEPVATRGTTCDVGSMGTPMGTTGGGVGGYCGHSHGGQFRGMPAGSHRVP